jgi:hypothetical protein
MADTKHVVLIHGTWLRGDSWGHDRHEVSAGHLRRDSAV